MALVVLSMGFLEWAKFEFTSSCDPGLILLLFPFVAFIFIYMTFTSVDREEMMVEGPKVGTADAGQSKDRCARGKDAVCVVGLGPLRCGHHGTGFARL